MPLFMSEVIAALATSVAMGPGCMLDHHADVAPDPLMVLMNDSGHNAEDETFLTSVVKLTNRDQFSRAGEAYFSPDSEWIIFQAVPSEEETGGQPKYAMFVAKIIRDPAAGSITGIEEPIRISPPGSANTCGWFHPNLPGVVLFGSTIVEPESEVDAGYSRENSRYTWDFPREMEVVTRTIPAIVEDSVRNPELKSKLLARPDVDRPVPMWERDGYDAEGSWSPCGRFVLHSSVDPKTKDADIFVYDIAGDRRIPLVVAPGYDGGPFFSADGKWICYRSDREGNDLLQLFISELDFDHRGVPKGIKREIQLTDNRHVNWAPYWHPSGEYLVYASSEVSHRNYEVFAIPAVTENMPGTSHSHADTAHAHDGHVHEHEHEHEHHASHISVVVDRPTIRVTHAAGFDGLPVFNPDGSLLMWTGQRLVDDPTTGSRSSQLYIAEVVNAYPDGLRKAMHDRASDETDAEQQQQQQRRQQQSASAQ
ncbi:MAG: TolB family protein [Planctomycetota bacterium]